jgi:hypothetical protein
MFEVRRKVRMGAKVFGLIVAVSWACLVGSLSSAQSFPSELPLASLFPAAGGDGTEGFVLTGVDQYDESGHAVRAAGDINGDGIDDLVIGACGIDAGGYRSDGQAYVVFGRSDGFPPVFPLSSLLPEGGGDGSAGFVLVGRPVRSASGCSVSAAGDVNADGIADLIIGAHDSVVDGKPFVGEAT